MRAVEGVPITIQVSRMKVKFIGAIERVTGSCTLMEQPETGLRFLIDCGMTQGEPNSVAKNVQPWPFIASRIDFVLLTHAHLDHCGLLPRLVREGFSGLIYCTRFTAELARLNLLSAANMSGAPFTRMDVEQLQFEYIDGTPGFAFDHPVQLRKGLRVSFRPSAHIGGACSITVSWIAGQGTWTDMVFSGDLGPNTEQLAPQPLLAGRPPLPGSPTFVLVESTYGGRLRDEKLLDAEHRVAEWMRIIRASIAESGEHGSAIIVPCFSIHRCQELLLDLHVALERKLRDEIVSVRPWIDEEHHRIRALDAGIAVSRVERRVNMMHEWPPERRAAFDRTFVRCDETTAEGKTRSVYRPISDDASVRAEALSLIAEMRVFTPVRRIQVIVDSPLAQKATSVYGRELRRRLPSDPTGSMYRHPGLKEFLGAESETALDTTLGRILLDGRQAESEFTSYSLKFCSPLDVDEVMQSGDINIVLSSSGMGDVGPIVPHLARELPRQRATVVLTGYADPETLGGKLRAVSRCGDLRSTTQLQIGDTSMAATDVRARIEDLGGFYSGHADSSGLLDFIFQRSPAGAGDGGACTVFINHGDDSKRNALAQAIHERSAAQMQGDCVVARVEVPSAESEWFDLDAQAWIADEPVRGEDAMHELLLRMVLEQKRTNDLLAEMLRLQRPQKPAPIKKQKG